MAKRSMASTEVDGQAASNLKIGYARVSTGDQNLAMQIAALKSAGCDRIFEETASGAKSDRPILATALSHLRAGDTFVVWRLDRLGRSLPHLVELVADFKQRGIGLRSLTDPVDTTSAAGELVFNIFASLAQFERQLTRERTMAGLEAARARGRKGGRKPKLNRKSFKEVKALLQDPDITRAAIAKRYGISRSTLYVYMANEYSASEKAT